MLLALSLFAEVNVGDNAPDFSLKTLDGKKTYTMKDFKGKVVLLNLWASWCRGCKKEMPEFISFQKEMPKDFRVVAVNLDNSKDKAKTFLSTLKREIPFVVLYDSKKELAKAYDCSALPTSYLIDKNGIVKRSIIGRLNEEQIKKLQKEIEQLR